MNRVFDERLELQLQEYEFAELDLRFPAGTRQNADLEEDEFGLAMDAIINRH